MAKVPDVMLHHREHWAAGTRAIGFGWPARLLPPHLQHMCPPCEPPWLHPKHSTAGLTWPEPPELGPPRRLTTIDTGACSRITPLPAALQLSSGSGSGHWGAGGYHQRNSGCYTLRPVLWGLNWLLHFKGMQGGTAQVWKHPAPGIHIDASGQVAGVLCW